ncbi:MAG: hypothetical protein M0R77_00095 [Gammaproteobacteria bacterium]|nr:hypothetical protein [Acholeplasmataceae bacterium]MCK9528954.1 hypothetical protein [Gammaproteobacteria bacterium]
MSTNAQETIKETVTETVVETEKVQTENKWVKIAKYTGITLGAAAGIAAVGYYFRDSIAGVVRSDAVSEVLGEAVENGGEVVAASLRSFL